VPRLGQNGIIIGRGEDDISDNAAWALLIYGNKFAVQLEDQLDRDFVYEPPSEIRAGVWHHVAATRDSTDRLILYVDGEEIDNRWPTYVPSSSNAQNLTIGCYLSTEGSIPPPTGQPPVSWLAGMIDDVTMWDRALSANEVRDLYLHPPNPSAFGLVGFWRFDETSGQIAPDASSSMNHGTLGFTNTAAADDPAWTSYGIASVALRVEAERLIWNPSPRDGDLYDVVRGDLGLLRSTNGNFAVATKMCIADNQDSTILSETVTPNVGEGVWYLVRIIRPAGNGTYDSCADSQVAFRDPGIAASGVDCVP
jgi:hypothetical protein